MTAHTFGSLFVKAWFDGPSLDPSSWQPSQGFVRFVERIFGATRLLDITKLYALGLASRLRTRSTGTPQPGSEWRLCVVALMVSNKSLEDCSYLLSTWAEISNFPAGIIKDAEHALLHAINYKLRLTPSRWSAITLWVNTCLARRDEIMASIAALLHVTPVQTCVALPPVADPRPPPQSAPVSPTYVRRDTRKRAFEEDEGGGEDRRVRQRPVVPLPPRPGTAPALPAPPPFASASTCPYPFGSYYSAAYSYPFAHQIAPLPSAWHAPHIASDPNFLAQPADACKLYDAQDPPSATIVPAQTSIAWIAAGRPHGVQQQITVPLGGWPLRDDATLAPPPVWSEPEP